MAQYGCVMHSAYALIRLPLETYFYQSVHLVFKCLIFFVSFQQPRRSSQTSAWDVFARQSVVAIVR